MKFEGRVQFRSSKIPGSVGPVGETEILKLNPGREKLIVSATGWPRLEPGSLNLEVDQVVVDQLLRYKPLIEEDGRFIKYPKPYENIPKKRGVYFYYMASASANGKVQQVLVRRARNALRNRIELFAPVLIKSTLCVTENDYISIKVDEA